MSTTSRPAGNREATLAPLESRMVADAMHAGVITCTPAAPIPYIARLMADAGIHAVVVWGDEEEDSEGAWGLVSDLDLVAAVARGGSVARSAVGEARTPVVTVRAEDTLVRAAELMALHRAAHLVVVDGRDRPVGILSTLDVARTVADTS